MAMAFFGHMGVEWNLLKESDEALNKLGEWVAEYKRHRAWFAMTRACTPISPIRPSGSTAWSSRIVPRRSTGSRN